jgi:ketosteroid isomerase-like protein
MIDKKQILADLTTNYKKMVEMVEAGQVLEAFEMFYADDVVMMENGKMERVGKEANRKVEEDFFSKATDFKAKLLASSFNIDDQGVGIVVDVWHQSFNHNEWGVMDYDQGSITKWKDGKIIHQAFNYPSN